MGLGRSYGENRVEDDLKIGRRFVKKPLQTSSVPL